MRVGTIYYDFDMDQTVIKWNEAFTEQDWLLRADVMRDLAGLTQRKYDSVLDNVELYEGSK